MTSSSFNVRRWLPIILWMGVIFLGSTDFGSAAHTSSFVVPFLRWLFGRRLSAEGIDTVHFLMRKTWHVLEYAIFGALLWRAFAARTPSDPPAPDRSRLQIAAKAILAAALYAATDEFHQSFVPSRTATLHDVALDTCGAAAGLAIILIFTRKRV